MDLEIINQKIHTHRNVKVMLDYDLAALYEVLTKNLIKEIVHDFQQILCFN